MARSSNWFPGAGAGLALLVAACASVPPAGPVAFYASWSGEHPPTKPLFDAVDGRLRVEPGFVRDFTEPMNVHIADGAPTSEGRLRYQVRISLPSRMRGRRISRKDQTLAMFSVACEAERPDPCADEILARVRLQPARIGRIVARAPRAGPRDGSLKPAFR